jgi:mono/diheme cytochrome c family protein
VTRVGIAAAVIAVGAVIGSVVAWPDDAAAPRRSAPADGAEVFLAKGCATCHDGPDTTAAFGVGPSLADTASWAGERVASMSARDYVAESILVPSAVISPVFRADGPTTAMPTLDLSPGELESIVDYLVGR